MNISEKKKKLEENGWVLMKNVLSKEEVADLRKRVKETVGQGNTSNDWLSIDSLSHLVYDKRILEIAGGLLGGKPVYFGDSSYQIASKTPILHGFHKDSVDRYDPNGPDWQTPYTLIRMGLYLQDHSKHSEGLIVRSGSHKSTDLTKGKKVNVPTEIGDVVAWYLTTTHSGNAKRMKFLDFPVLVRNEEGSGVANYLYNNIPEMLVQKAEDERISMFTVFGLNDNHMSRYIEMYKHRREQVERWQRSIYKPDVLNKAKGANLDIKDMREEVKGINLSEVQEWDFHAKH